MSKEYPAEDKNHKFKIQDIKLECGIFVKVDWNSKTKCGGCGKEIFWAATKNEKIMPIELIGHCKWNTHFATCPDANKFRNN